MVEAILKDKKKILALARFLLEGEYGIKGLFCGRASEIGRRRAEEIIQIKLTAEEKAALDKSSASVKGIGESVLGI